MPEQHSHNDRGTLHGDCPACNVLVTLMGDAGLQPRWVSDKPFEPPSLSFLGVPMRKTSSTAGETVYTSARSLTDDEVDRFLNLTGQEMGNKATVISERGEDDEFVKLDSVNRPASLYGYLRQVARKGGKTSWLALASHLIEEHPCAAVDMISALPDLSAVQSMHGVLHAAGIGHGGPAEHMVRPADELKIASRARLADQRLASQFHRRARAAEAQRRSEAARAQRAQVQIDSIRNLQRAIQHTAGTVLPRMTSSAPADPVSVTVGTHGRATLAKARWAEHEALGTALCRAGDTFDYVTGAKLAVGRALIALGVLVESDGFRLDAYRSKR